MTPQWAAPEDVEVDQAMAAIADLSLRSLFFSKLENPEWLAPLDKRRVFADPPVPSVDADGTERVLPWPEGDYLIKVAPDRPKEVTAILLRLGVPANAWVQRAIVAATARLPGTEASKLVSTIADILKRSHWIDERELAVILESLSKSGEEQRLRQLLNAIFVLRRGEPEQMAFGTRPTLKATVDDYMYSQLLPKARPLLAALPDIRGLRLATGWLRTAAHIQSGGRKNRRDSDGSSVWRPSIAAHSQNSGLHELSDGLIDLVRDLALDLGHTGAQTGVVALLNEADVFVVRRIAVEVASQLVGEGAASLALLQPAFALLTDHSLMGIGSRPEYVRLARACLPRLTTEQREEWVELVTSGHWQGTDDDIRQVTAWSSKTPEAVTEEEITNTRNYYLHRFLEPLDGILPQSLQERLEALRAERGGQIEHAEFGSYMESFTGPSSPKAPKELAAMPAAELATFLLDWRPSGDRHFGPSVEGLARAVETVAETHPALVSDLADRMLELSRSYIRAIFSGLAKAVSNSRFVVPEAVWTVVREVARRADDVSDDESDEDFEADDPVWRFAQRSAINLIEAGIKSLPVPLSDRDARRYWEMLEPLTRHADPTPEHEARFGGNNMDPLTLSLNTTRPVALRAAIALASARHGAVAPGHPSTVEADILAAVAEHVDEPDPSVAVAAVVGEGIGRLWGIEPTWVQRREDALFAVLDSDEDKRARADVVVSVAMRVYQTTAGFLSLARPAFDQLLTSEYFKLEHTNGWRETRSTTQAAASHVLRGFLLQLIDLGDEHVQALFSGAVPAGVISEAVGHVGWQVARTPQETEIPTDYLDRCKLLVDWRVSEIGAGRASAAELSQFFWWAQSGRFEPAWWLPILLLVAETVEVDSHGMIGESLVNAASSEPLLATQAFEKLYGGLERDWRAFDLVQHAPRVLAAALQSDDENAISLARQLQDRLGRQGHFDALDELDELLANEA